MSRLNDLLCRSNKLFILFKQDNISFIRLIVSFEQVIYLVEKQDNNSFKRLIMSFAQVSNLF